MHKLIPRLALTLATLSFAACDESDIIESTPDGVIGSGLAVDVDVDVDIDDLALEADEMVGRAYCDDVTTWNSAWATLESQVITEVNKRRAAGATCGGVKKAAAPAVALRAALRCAARKHSRDMGKKNFFSHTGSNGSTFVQRIEWAAYTGWTALSENIAAGNTTAAAVVTAWMNSTGHCNNIMNPKFKHLGVGYYYLSTSTYKHYWTQDFGSK